jgi:hypothetical protein
MFPRGLSWTPSRLGFRLREIGRMSGLNDAIFDNQSIGRA